MMGSLPLSRRPTHLLSRVSWKLVTAICALLLLIPPTVALANVVTYATGNLGVGGTWRTTGYANRTFNRVYHKDGYEWALYYCDHTHCSSEIYGYANPTVDGRNFSNALALCRNIADNSGVTWTCQTDN